MRDLRKRYKSVQALDGVSLEIRKGEVVGFLGPNGAGKTTFTKCVLGFLRPQSGTIELFGKQVGTDNRSILANVGLVPDQYEFYTTLNGIQHLEYYGRLHGMKPDRIRQRIQEVLQMVGMTEFAPRRVRTYSHGMKQRLCIAQALLHEPEFIIFDEPTNGLDPRGAYEMRELIKSLSQQGITIFLSSHILGEVEQVCSRVAIISRGKVLVEAGVEELRQKMRGDKLRVTVTVENPSPDLADQLLRNGIAQEAHAEGNRIVCVLLPEVQIPDLVTELSKAGARIQGVQEEQVGLEQVFLELTKGEGGL